MLKSSKALFSIPVSVATAAIAVLSAEQKKLAPESAAYFTKIVQPLNKDMAMKLSIDATSNLEVVIAAEDGIDAAALKKQIDATHRTGDIVCFDKDGDYVGVVAGTETLAVTKSSGSGCLPQHLKTKEVLA